MRMSTLSEARKRYWDANLSLITTLVALAGLFVGIWEFNEGEKGKIKLEYESLNAKDRLDFNRKLWLERLDTYRGTADAAGKISDAVGRGENFDSELKVFEAAYWGRMILVEDPAVAREMQKFRGEIQLYKDKYQNADQVRRAADRLGEELRASLYREPVAVDSKVTEEASPQK
jgi:hypothetical protein